MVFEDILLNLGEFDGIEGIHARLAIFTGASPKWCRSDIFRTQQFASGLQVVPEASSVRCSLDSQVGIDLLDVGMVPFGFLKRFGHPWLFIITQP